MSYEKENFESVSSVSSEGLGAELNVRVAEWAKEGNYESLLSVIEQADDADIACAVIIRSIDEFRPGEDRAAAYNNLVRQALRDIDRHGGALKALVFRAWQAHKSGERFIRNPVNGETLFIDGDGELISFKGEINMHQQGVAAGMDYVSRLSSYTVLTGPQRSTVFTSDERPIPYPTPNGTSEV